MSTARHTFSLLPGSPSIVGQSEDLRQLCATVPGMNVYQPIATYAVELCVAAASIKTHNGQLAATSWSDGDFDQRNEPALISTTYSVSGIFEQNLDAIRRHIEQMPVGSGKKATFVGYKSKRELSRLKADLENHLCAVLAIGGTISPAASRSDCVLELLSEHPCRGFRL
ncbi:hypothetical protein B0H17DRAFT_15597 [Mycena rosella]|uniref:Uncharacterized protein n=1 Tax=Mycena rosella TaxID=1033263 RepID=A0AAD7B4B1_MYCRO|nr:hypothetical protein B0H17DRAFT_15597 [Mycena rosella]